jgi:hypothetical protein
MHNAPSNDRQDQAQQRAGLGYISPRVNPPIPILIQQWLPTAIFHNSLEIVNLQSHRSCFIGKSRTFSKQLITEL